MKELNAVEIKETDGGVVGLDDIALAAGDLIVGVILTDWANFKQGFIDGLNGN